MFVHENAAAFSMIEAPDELLLDISRSLWEEFVLPWVLRLHAEQSTATALTHQERDRETPS